MIAHLPCTHLARSGARWFHLKQREQEEALEFFCRLLNAEVGRVCVENPVGVVGTRICRYTQLVHPYWFGDPERKQTGLWLRNLPPLKPTKVVEPDLMTLWNGKTMSRAFAMVNPKGEGGSLTRGHVRSRFPPGKPSRRWIPAPRTTPEDRRGRRTAPRWERSTRQSTACTARCRRGRSCPGDRSGPRPVFRGTSAAGRRAGMRSGA